MAVVWNSRSVLHRATGGLKATTAFCDERRSFAERPSRSQLLGIARSHQLPNRFQKIRIRRVHMHEHDGERTCRAEVVRTPSSVSSA